MAPNPVAGILDKSGTAAALPAPPRSRTICESRRDPPPRTPRSRATTSRTSGPSSRGCARALGLIGLGFVLARMGLFLRQLEAASLLREGAKIRFHAGHEFIVSGVVFLVIGTVLCGWAGRRYGTNRRTIDAGRYVPAAESVRALTALVVAGGLVIAGMVIWPT